MRDMMRLCDVVTDEEWLVLVKALACFIEYKEERYKDTNFDLFGEELEIAKNLMRKLYGRDETMLCRPESLQQRRWKNTKENWEVILAKLK